MSPKKNSAESEKTANLNGKYATRNQIISGIFLLLGIAFTWYLNRGSGEMKNESIQNVQEQKVDSGSIQNYNANGNIIIQNNNSIPLLNNVDSGQIKQIHRKKKPSKDIQKNDTTINVTSNNQSGGQTANQITNNY